jgi:ADP-dependent phosphofructokinase/glucokinase
MEDIYGGIYMAYKDIYRTYLEQIPEDIEKCIKTGKRHVFGYTSDLDVIVKWNTQTFNDVIKKYLKENPSAKEGETIDSMEDFARIVSCYAIKGLGGEVDITNIEVCEYLERNFETTFALGGTCAQGAAAMNAIGFPIIAHLTDKSKEVCNIINNPSFYLISKDGPVSIDKINSNELPVRHMIIQYTKGDKIIIDGKEYSVPESNRIIIDYDKIHKYVPIEKAFLDYCEENSEQIYSYNISGFNAIIDINILEERLSELSEHYSRVKAKNPECIIYLESAHYLNTKSKMLAFEKLSKHIDILGMNEEELVELSGQLGFTTNKDDLESVIEGLELVTEQYNVKSIVMHTKDYSMYYGEKIDGVDIEKGLTLGNLMSGTRARTGRYGSYEDCRESLALDLSPLGAAFAEKIKNMKFEKDVHLVPSRYMEHPICTIGLGDTFTAGMQICFTK